MSKKTKIPKRIRTEVLLVIEDEGDVRNFVSRVLEMEGYQVIQTDNGETGLKLVREEATICLVLLDLHLPKMDGWSVLEQLKSSPELATIPVIIFTALAGEKPHERALTMGAVDYLVKPLSAAQLRKAVSRALYHRR